ncbi:2-oxoglutarate dehydrogenase complex dihydrolipoyllysine-residue succinyltransferase [Bacillus spizizenii]|jgi:2-oxoglutarate dehydrogenase E2 component (dihydrolipoamide succinyltransferase)|uniref:2-oxoglutarate dehydrogenase complex dihydrolipoyllysine-residue succinyltransferase n=1 Tax=Bacillus spizizenii TaxID=96241 RepID=UPI0002DA2BBD|nr:2-oxoglutarate dehydrogenase complex dihydrolipoyllysine-residue succinyltransferase [Bacillus spizizenii]MCI4170296.1 2-oxoglutarate dehydrogenase complex dihydrolipoyllysine-residue succinyltransferase [Bacillus spizizenii]MEC1436891.1 2-oxoglutarate dehydrogenase complex dihydrolipoyllysine-residue succinyltransferase [Bacillus spizizenii]MEC1526448.1 2-oxoglutarate dehydrogenase complex dihydrolipoyllysine-residue succinyltransferase [Bacillus spizizenii]MEC1587798.1 2-oxoglutarate dehyd
MAEIKVPELAESISEGTIAQWLKQPGDYVEQGEYLLELETDKVNVELTAEESGVLQEVLKDSGDTVQVGEIIGTISEGAGESSAPAPSEKAESKDSEKEEKQAEPAAKEVSEEAQAEAKSRTIASPSARKLAREKGIDLSQVPTGDPLGRVRKQDVEAYEKPASKPAPQKQQQPQAQKTQQSFDKPVEVQKMSRRRQTIAKRLVEVQQTSAMLTTFNEVDMTAVMNLRKRRKDQFFEQNEVKLGFMSFFTKAVVAALKKYPLLNAEIQGDELIVKKFYDIGIAVAADEGLVVPVVRDADRLTFAGIEKEIGELAKKARNNKLTLSELQGGSFTITNGGTFGSLMSTPILNSPQVGILGMHKIQLRPVAIDEERFENRPMMYIALSYDHRIVDGKEAVGFLVTIKNLLEDPEQLLLEG